MKLAKAIATIAFVTDPMEGIRVRAEPDREPRKAYGAAEARAARRSDGESELLPPRDAMLSPATQTCGGRLTEGAECSCSALNVALQSTW